MDPPHAHRPIEIAFEAARDHADPEGSLRLDLIVEPPSGRTLRLPAYRVDGRRWAARYASGEIGRHTYVSACSDRSDAGLHGVEGTVEVEPYTGDNPLYAHGPLRISSSGRHFEHDDGTPFFWLGDTWWMGLCRRLRWPEEFAELAEDRRRKGYTVVQIVAGLYPDMGAFDERGANEAGFPWEEDWRRIRPEYFDMADRRIERLVATGIVPCIVGAWGYYLSWLGHRKMQQHWRYLIARWAAYPVVWCVAGEANLPWYLAPGFPYDDRPAVTGWTEIAGYVRQLDPYRRPLSIHPTGLGRLSARGSIDDQGLLDFDMLQTGHGDRDSLGPTVDTLRWSYQAEPRMPVLNSEVTYEGILGRCHDDVQRLMFWTSILNGACGHTYGANGIWQMNGTETPYGASPHGGTYGPTPWREAMALPGSMQLAWARRLLERYRWWEMEPLPDTADYAEGLIARDDWHRPHAARIGDDLRIIYAPQAHRLRLRGLEGATWRATAWEPANGAEAHLGPIDATDGCAELSRPFTPDVLQPEQDWLLILERA